MLLVRVPRLRRMLPLAVCLGLAVPPGTPVRAAHKPLAAEEQAKIDRAIDKAVAYLKRSQHKSGAWPSTTKEIQDRFPCGYALLPGLALLESGVPADDPAVRKVAELVRQKANKVHATYDLALAVLFLDRLGEPADEKLIRSFALRLVAGQCRTGGWNYRCPTVSPSNEKALWELLPRLQPEGAAEKEEVPKQFKMLTLAQPPSQRTWSDPPGNTTTVYKQLFTGHTDNSNTQFALLALWAARRHGVPVDATLRLAAERFERSQNPDGTWNYMFQLGGGPPKQERVTRAMPAVGVLALAIGQALKAPPISQPPHPRLSLGLAAMVREMGQPTGQWQRRVPMTDVYYLWSLERTGVLFGLPEIADRDWYRWGAEILVTNQTQRGDWTEWSLGPRDAKSTYGHAINTSFALLFLKRANLTRDLRSKLPFKPEALNASVMARLKGNDFLTQPASASPGERPQKP